jgi:tetratricopeptide (TPR) repeat protein
MIRISAILVFLAAAAAALGAAAVAANAPEFTLQARSHDIVTVRGLAKPQSGTIEKENDNLIEFRTVRGIRHVWPKSQITSILRKCTSLQAYKKAQQLAGTDPAARLRLHTACVTAGLKKEAVDEVHAAVKFGPTHLPAYEKLLEIARANKDLDLELGTLEAASREKIATVPMLMRKARMYVKLGIVRSARKPLEDVLAKQPSNSDAEGRLAMLDLMGDKREAAAAHVAAMLKRDGKDPNALTVRGLLEFDGGNRVKASAAFGEAARTSKSPVAAAATGALAIRQNRLGDAAKHYAQAQALSPSFAPTLAGLGLLAAHAGKGAKAKGLLAQAVAAAPGRPEIIVAQAYAAERAGDHDTALQTYQAALKLDRPNVYALCGAGRCQLAKGDRRSARQSFEQALSLHPGFAPALRGLGRLMLGAKPRVAIGYLQKVARSGAATAEDHVALAIALIPRQRFGEATAALAKAGDDNVHARIARGFLAYSQGRDEEAKAHFNAATALGDHRRYAANCLRRIREAEDRVTWSDNFEREDSPEVRNGWIEVQPMGVTIAISGNAVLIDGTPGGDNQMTRLVQNDTSKFVSVTAKAKPGDPADSWFGVFVGRRGGQDMVRFGREAGGQVAVQAPGKPWRKLPRRVAPGPFSVGIELVDQKAGKVRLWLNGRRLGRAGQLTVPKLGGATELEVGVFALPATGKKVNCTFMEVTIVRAK